MVFMPHWPQLLGTKPIDLGLNRVLALLKALGNPHLKLPPVIHVAGTNGKGSTIAFLRSILQASGYKVHVYTSPHLLHFNERIVLAGETITDEKLYEIMETCRLASTDHAIPVTFFEGTTVGAFLAFSQIAADIILLETGLGGRLDATNVIPNPALTLITSISYDHMEFLGSTLPLIAGEKAGIMKTDVPCITSLQPDEVDQTLESYAASVPCPLLSFGYAWHSEPHPEGMLFHDAASDTSTTYPLPALQGSHQIINAGNAICAIKNLVKQQASGFSIDDTAIAKGLTSTQWPARLQQLTRGRLVSHFPKDTGWELWVDGAHNEAGAYVLAQHLASMPEKPLHLIFGMTKGRDISLFLKHFHTLSPTVTGVLIQTEPSAYSASRVVAEAKKAGLSAVSAESVEEAIEQLVRTRTKPARIVCAGSLYLASDVFKENNQPLTFC